MIKKILITLGHPIYKTIVLMIQFVVKICNKFVKNIKDINTDIKNDLNKLNRFIKQIKIKIGLWRVNINKKIEIKVKMILNNFKLKFRTKKIKPFKKGKVLFKGKVIKIENNKSYTKIYLGLFGIFILLTVFVFWFYRVIMLNLPNVNEIYNPPKLSTKIYDRKGVLLYTFYKDENRSWVELNKIPKEMVEATLAIEDKDFFNHKGISIKGIFLALWHNLKNNDDSQLRGGSTITQQLVKNVFLSGEKTWKRKITELILSIMVENKLTKNEILERYFNQVAYGGETYGIEAASEKYFGKKIENISLNEATFLAGLPAAPSSYLPNGQGLSLAYQRQRQVIEQMVIAGFINQQVANDLFLNNVEIIKEDKGIKAPHFVFYVKEYLQNKLGFENIERRGLSIYTTLDFETQKMAEKIVSDEVLKVSRLKIGNGAAMVTDPRSGDILAMVGSKNYWASDIDGKFNITTAQRQPGSSIKPINYLLGLERGKSLSSLIDDSPITYQIKGQKPYSPQNYNGKYMGRVSLKTALASSLNIPSVKLLNENGVENMINLAESMGITTWDDRSRFGLSLALGAGEVKMVEMAEAYSIFSQLGNRVIINPILKINNYLGESVYQKNVEVKYVTEPKYAYLIDMALSDDSARAPIFGLGSKLKIANKTVAVKTGTTNSLKDNWCIGWTPEVMVLAWVGNNDNTPMSWVASGISGATPIWNLIMKEILSKNLSDVSWNMPAGIYSAKSCGKEGLFTDSREINLECPIISPTLAPI